MNVWNGYQSGPIDSWLREGDNHGQTSCLRNFDPCVDHTQSVNLTLHFLFEHRPLNH